MQTKFSAIVMILALSQIAPIAHGQNRGERYCPAGSLYHPMNYLCISASEAIGPFPPTMVAQCRAFSPGNSICERDNWEIFLAGSLRGTSTCPPGTSWDKGLEACVEGETAWGPFSVKQANTCKQNNWGNICDTMRWPSDILKGVYNTDPTPDTRPTPRPTPHPDPGPIQSEINRTLFRYYSQRENYDAVYDDVMGWYGTTSDGCVAFISTALRHIGVKIPKTNDASGYNISLWTAALSNYLKNGLGWRTIYAADALQSGDVVFSVGLRSSPEIPLHVFMFHSWSSREQGRGLVIDNQGFIHERPVAYGNEQFSAFAYALRGE